MIAASHVMHTDRHGSIARRLPAVSPPLSLAHICHEAAQLRLGQHAIQVLDCNCHKAPCRLILHSRQLLCIEPRPGEPMSDISPGRAERKRKGFLGWNSCAASRRVLQAGKLAAAAQTYHLQVASHSTSPLLSVTKRGRTSPARQLSAQHGCGGGKASGRRSSA